MFDNFTFGNEILISPCIDNLATMHSRSRPNINNIISLTNDFFLMLNNYNSIAEITQLIQYFQ